MQLTALIALVLLITLSRPNQLNLIVKSSYKIAYTTLIAARISNPTIARSNIQIIASTTPVALRIVPVVKRQLLIPLYLLNPLTS
jgi:hypothetical protein